MIAGWRSQLANALNGRNDHPILQISVKLFLVVVIAFSVVAVAFETLEEVARAYGNALAAIELVTVGILTVEYALRLWVAPEHDPCGASNPWRARLGYAISVFGIIDLVAILPFYLNLLLPIHPDWLRVLRLSPLLKGAYPWCISVGAYRCQVCISAHIGVRLWLFDITYWCQALVV